MKKLFTRISSHGTHSIAVDPRNKAVDGYRAVAVILVILSHLDVPYVPGQTGVLFFFVISGYVITSSIIRECNVTHKFSLKNFFLRRSFKLLPPLFLIIILPTLLFIEFIDMAALASQAFFFYNWWYLINSSTGTLDGSQVVWSLSVEEQYYIFIAIAVTVIFHFFRSYFVLALTVLYSIVFFCSTILRGVVYFYSNAQNEFGDVFRILYGTDTRVSAIALGGLLSVYLNSERFTQRVVEIFKRFEFPIHLGLIVLAAFSVFYREALFRNIFKYTVQEVVCAILILYAVAFPVSNGYLQKIMKAKWLQTVGLASYSIYLSHLVLINLLRNSDLINFSIHYQWLEVAVLFVICLIGGCILHAIVDKPFERYRRKYR